MPSVSFYTLGCKLNYAETSTIERDFERRGFDVLPFGDGADVTVVNTCSVTAEAERKCRNVIRRALRTNPHTFVAVTGCYAQLRPDDIAAIEGVDVVLGANEKFGLFQLVDAFTKRPKTQVEVSCIDEARPFGQAFSSGERTRAFLKIQDGCDYNCAFCTIPLARGKSRSLAPDAVLKQAREIAALGYREIVLTGVNIGLYRGDDGTDLLALLHALEDVEGIARYRISSIEPNLLTDTIVDFVAASDVFVPHFHLPLQSGDDYVLGKMRRRYRRSVYADRVRHIEDLMPHACIGVDVITGFPAEDEERFENTYAFLEALPVAYLHAFTYSERPDTTAVDEPGKIGGAPVPKPERSARNRRLRLLSKKKEQAFYRRQLGTTRRVLWEDDDHDGRMHGYTDNYIRLERPYEANRAGMLEHVVLRELTPRGTVSIGDR